MLLFLSRISLLSYCLQYFIRRLSPELSASTASCAALGVSGCEYISLFFDIIVLRHRTVREYVFTILDFRWLNMLLSTVDSTTIIWLFDFLLPNRLSHIFGLLVIHGLLRLADGPFLVLNFSSMLLVFFDFNCGNDQATFC